MFIIVRGDCVTPSSQIGQVRNVDSDLAYSYSYKKEYWQITKEYLALAVDVDLDGMIRQSDGERICKMVKACFWGRSKKTGLFMFLAIFI